MPGKKITGKLHKHLCSNKRLEARKLFDESLSAQHWCLPASCLECHLLRMSQSCLQQSFTQKPDSIMFVTYILAMVGIQGQQNNHLHSIFKVGWYSYLSGQTPPFSLKCLFLCSTAYSKPLNHCWVKPLHCRKWGSPWRRLSYIWSLKIFLE